MVYGRKNIIYQNSVYKNQAHTFHVKTFEWRKEYFIRVPRDSIEQNLLLYRRQIVKLDTTPFLLVL